MSKTPLPLATTEKHQEIFAFIVQKAARLSLSRNGNPFQFHLRASLPPAILSVRNYATSSVSYMHTCIHTCIHTCMHAYIHQVQVHHDDIRWGHMSPPRPICLLFLK